MASPYLVPVAQLLSNVPSTSRVEFDAPFDLRHEFTPRGPAETDVDPDENVHLQLNLQSFSGGLRVKGYVATTWHGLCRRCSVVVTGPLNIAVDERYVDVRGLLDDDAYEIVQDFVDLEPLAHDAILLELPLAPLCRPDCAGLCPICGNDRNESLCSCVAPVDPRWATLDGLLFADDASQESNQD